MKNRTTVFYPVATRSLNSLLVVFLFLCNGIAHANSQLVVDAAGHVVGYWDGQSGICNDVSTIPVYSSTDYLACVTNIGKIDYSLQPPGTLGQWEGSFYNSPDCSGVSYATQFNGELAGGYVVATPTGLKGALIGANVYSFGVSSRLDGTPGSTHCTTYASPFYFPIVELLPVSDMGLGQPNPIGAGFNPSPYIPPFTVQSLPDIAVQDVIFFDFFDFEY